MTSNLRFKIVVIELNDVVPRRDPGKPNLYVRLASSGSGSLEELVAKSHAWVHGNALSLRPDLMPSGGFQTQKRADNKAKSLRSTLRSRGFTVNRSNAEVFRLYVIDLEPLPGEDVGRGVVYVGETSRTIEARYEQHKQGVRASRHVTTRGTGLRHDLIPNVAYYSRGASRAAEARLAERLRLKGFKVKGGH